MKNGKFPFLCALASTFAVAHAADPAPQKISSADNAFFEERVRPVLSEKCYSCHSAKAEKVKAGLLLDTRQGLLDGGNTGPAIVPGKPDDSLLIQAIRYHDEDLAMPPKSKGGKLPDRVIADFTEWVKRGAPDPRIGATTTASAAAPYTGVGKNHWAFKPVSAPAIPAVKDTAWARTPIDHFVLAKLEAAQLAPSSPADRRTLLRRITFDLIGLPPSLQEMDDFVRDTSPDAFAKVVDRLLAMPEYGERWARHWMDIARYAETKGDAPRQDDLRYPHAWTYRDYLINAFNSDKPYDRFIFEQLAADQLYKNEVGKNTPTPEQRASVAALGFLTLGNQFNGMKNDVINDQIDVTTKAFLGLTVACARCHDHKFDPIPTKDYYSLYGVFASTYQPKELPVLQPVPKNEDTLAYFAKKEELTKKADAIEAEFIAFRRSKDKNATVRQDLIRRQRAISRDIGDLESSHPGAPAKAHVLLDNAAPKNYPVLIRGEAEQKGEIVPRRFLEVLSPNPKNRPAYTQGSGRLQLAQDIADPANPLTARTLVNRVWQHHFGVGIVATPDDLGNMSAPPTHPELLDYLATQFVKNDWSIKKLHREILLSATYQQNSDYRAAAFAVDAGNQLLWRFNLRRLDFEALHDSILAISGTLEPKLGGRSVLMGSEGFASRRALYTYIDRRNPPELLTQFDFPSPDIPSGRRYETTVPQQALFLMNSPLVMETARKLTQDPTFAAQKTDQDRIRYLYLTIYQRLPSSEEQKLCLSYLKATPPEPDTAKLPLKQQQLREANKAAQQAKKAAQGFTKGKKFDLNPAGGIASSGPLDPWAKLAHSLFQSNEVMYVN